MSLLLPPQAQTSKGELTPQLAHTHSGPGNRLHVRPVVRVASRPEKHGIVAYSDVKRRTLC